MTVFELKIDWANEDDEGLTTELYSTYEKAKKAMNLEIVQAMQDYDVYEKADGSLTKPNWLLDKGNDYWAFYEKGYYCSNHCVITIDKKEIK